MTLNKNEFDILAALDAGVGESQRDIARHTGLSLGTVNAVYRTLSEHGLIDGFSVTAQGYEALAPYRVDNAVIMAAGLSSRFVPLSYERPKGLLHVRGEVLIERQIRQLQEAGIDDITVVVGYLKESFFYLEDLYGVSIVVNEEYAERNNNSTLMRVKDRLANTYICSSDDYFTENVFAPYVYRAYYAAVYNEGATDEYCIAGGTGGRIVSVSIGGADSYVMLGHAYFDRAFSEAFVGILEAEYDRPETAPKLWEDIYREHLKELSMVIKPYDEGVIYEFDSLKDLCAFDQDVFENVDSCILDNIVATLGCARLDITDIVPIKEGMTNLSFSFSVDGTSYVYRHPGVGTEAIINRESETFTQSVAHKLGIDETYVHEDPHEGWKISRFIDGCIPFDYHNPDHVAKGMELIKRLHDSGEASAWEFDIHEDTKKILSLLDKQRRVAFRDFGELYDRADRIAELLKEDGVAPCLCHNDFYDSNFLINDSCFYLIDWEYSGMSDYASDLGVFVCCSDYTYDEALEVFEVYFGRPLTPAELRHCVAYTALTSYHWFIWALYQEMTGSPVGEYLYLWYRYSKLYAEKAFELYGIAEGEDVIPA